MQVLLALGWTPSKQAQQGSVVAAIEGGSVDSMDIVEAPLSLTPRLVGQVVRLPFQMHSKSAAVFNHQVARNHCMILSHVVLAYTHAGLKGQV